MRIELPSNEIIALNTVESMVQSLLADQVINSEQFGSILMVLNEAVTNAIVHGNNHDEKKKVFLDYSIEDHSVEFSVTDQGSGYSISLEENLEFFESQYPGLALIHKLSDQVTFNESKNSIQLQFNVVSAHEKLSNQRSNILLKARSKTLNQSSANFQK